MSCILCILCIQDIIYVDFGSRQYNKAPEAVTKRNWLRPWHIHIFNMARNFVGPRTRSILLFLSLYLSHSLRCRHYTVCQCKQPLLGFQLMNREWSGAFRTDHRKHFCEVGTALNCASLSFVPKITWFFFFLSFCLASSTSSALLSTFNAFTKLIFTKVLYTLNKLYLILISIILFI